ncbi:MAG: DUF3014 domain-containing protein [Acidobacteriota bacterium]|nr:DUF3014 domain-containing protein [Acidobacteriota bacterium]
MVRLDEVRLDEVSLDRHAAGSDVPARDPGGRGSSRWIAMAGLAAIVAGLIYFVWIARRPATNAETAPTTSTEIPLAAATSLALPDEPLPPLAASDGFVRRVVALLSAHPAIARWLVADGLIQRTAIAVEQAGDGRSPSTPFAFARPSTRAATTARSTGLVIDPASHRRWDDLTSAIVSADPQQAAELYRHLRPLFIESYREMGHADGNFDAAIGRAGGRVLATPVVREPIDVEARRGYVEHVSPELRALPGISRQLLLMGPSNVERLQAWVTRFLNAAAIEPR